MPDFDLTSVSAAELWRMAVALAIGLIIGAEREQRKAEGTNRGAAGIRTFTTVALLGAVAALVHPALLATLGAAVALAAVAGYALGDRTDPGLTTEAALMLTYGLGALATNRPAVAMAVAVCAAGVLAARETLHSFLKDTLSARELRDALVLAVSALVVLPLIPDRPVGPFLALNLHTLWRLAVVMMALTASGYVAQRALGTRVGLAIAGLAGGFVSSIATIGAMGERARQSPELRSGAVAAAAASTVSTFVMLSVMVGLADVELLRHLGWPLFTGGLAAAIYAGVWERTVMSHPPPAPKEGRAFKLSSALAFAALVGLVGTVSAFAAERFGASAVELTAALAGFADTHATAASTASLHADGKIPEAVALVAVLIAFTTNASTKVVVSFTSGPRAFAWRVSLGQLLVVCATWAGFGAWSLLR